MRLIRLVAFLAALTVSTLWFAPPVHAAPLVIPAPPREGIPVPNDPPVTADSWVLYDADAELVLGSSAVDVERPMASTTKIMTAIVALKYGDLTDRVRISAEAAAVGEAEVGLVTGERVTLGRLLTALVVRSANDAAMAVAQHIGGSVDGFVEMMNREAESMGLGDTHFTNPHGLDTENHHASSADLLEMSLVAMSYPEFRERAALLEAEFPDAPDGTPRHLEATNLMLETYPGTIGVKTGYTGEAGLVFAAAAVREGRTLFAVVMGSEGQRAHFADAGVLFDWGYERFRSVAVVGAGTYEPPEPVRVVEAEPEEPPPPVVVTRVRQADGEPPALIQALGWVGRILERVVNG